MELDPVIKAYVEPDPTLWAQAAPAVAQFAAVFPLKKLDAAGGSKKRKPWRELINDERAAVPRLAEPGAAGADVKLEALLDADVTEVSASDPLGTFAKIMARRDSAEHIPSACAAMWTLITDSVHKSIRASLYQRAMDCLRALRDGCLQVY